jgi:hypothetical protein
MIRKTKITVSPLQKLEYAKLMVEQGYTNKQIEDMLCVNAKRYPYLILRSCVARCACS